MEKVKRGDVSQSSFSFATKDDKWEKRSGKEHRTVLKLKRLYDVAPVTYAAYQNTSVAMRSLTTINEDYKKDLAEMDLVAMKLQLNK
jgi:HK97 family phage prohead protease